MKTILQSFKFVMRRTDKSKFDKKTAHKIHYKLNLNLLSIFFDNFKCFIFQWTVKFTNFVENKLKFNLNHTWRSVTIIDYFTFIGY